MMPIIHGIVTNTINKSPGRKKLEKGVPTNNDDDSVNGYSGRIIKIIPTPNAEKQIIERNKISRKKNRQYLIKYLIQLNINGFRRGMQSLQKLKKSRLEYILYTEEKRILYFQLFIKFEKSFGFMFFRQTCL